MKLSISNLAWSMPEDELVYEQMQKYGFTGLEIAPTRVWEENPYERGMEAKDWVEKLKVRHGVSIPSMQSIWYGRSEKIFGSKAERQALIDYTKKAIRFAEAIGCGNLVFGCPRNRFFPDRTNPQIGIDFFREIGNYAVVHHTCIGLEANPPIYQTNYINTTQQALDIISEVGSQGLKLNLDVGTMISNEEDVSLLEGKVKLINHVHISEPFLKPIKKHSLHRELATFLRRAGYDRYISIEMGRVMNLSTIWEVMAYVQEVFSEKG